MTREITHMKAFTAALESMGKPAFSIGRIPPTPGLVDQYFNDSTGTGDAGSPTPRGPWNEGGDWEMVTAPAFQEFESARSRHPAARSQRQAKNRFDLKRTTITCHNLKNYSSNNCRISSMPKDS